MTNTYCFSLRNPTLLLRPNGNLTKEGSTRYLQWGHNDKLATFSNQAGSSDPTVYTNYFYNSAGERVKKITRKGQKLEVTVYVDGGLFELTYIKPNGTTIDSQRHYNTLYLKDGTSTIATRRIGQNVDDDSPWTKYYLEDHLNSCTVILRPNGNLVNREEFYPFGETSFGAYAFKRYRYNGKEKDEESGLYNYGQRYYAPWLCRFVSVDPIAEDYPQLSSYNYAGNKPITSPDIDGLQGTEDGNGPTGGNDSVQADQLPDRNGMPNYLLTEVEVTGTHSFAEGETQSVPSAQINPVDGTATVDFQTYFYHRGLSENDTESGWYSFADYSERVFNAGKSDGYFDLNTGDVSEPFYSDGRPLAENYEEKFSGIYDAGVGAGMQQRAFDMSGKAETTAVEFNVMLAVATLGQLNSAKFVTTKGVEAISGNGSKSAFEGVRAASAFLQKEGVPRAIRKRVIQSFELETISLQTAGNSTFGLRFYGGKYSQELGRYLFPTFTNHTNRAGLGLVHKWNSMTGLTQFQLAPGSTYIYGRAASQGVGLRGGSYQMYVNDLGNLMR